ncbi:hypothetical protein [Curtobacterium sp. MCPF17_052]|uniref:hypothetical protein n=1 Tax=Curtobacterium sp. MCPF17_052 TaxID=2175655 RepID=UPI0024DFDE04|nr:hypothetical protein [Curtobacterium sp. MCPF17_052]WIB12210.1 hypothetical protein DEJ36_15955 [Curtobacterium sp. MCPF17_052]
MRLGRRDRRVRALLRRLRRRGLRLGVRGERGALVLGPGRLVVQRGRRLRRDGGVVQHAGPGRGQLVERAQLVEQGVRVPRRRDPGGHLVGRAVAVQVRGQPSRPCLRALGGRCGLVGMGLEARGRPRGLGQVRLGLRRLRGPVEGDLRLRGRLCLHRLQGCPDLRDLGLLGLLVPPPRAARPATSGSRWRTPVRK